MDEVAEPDGGVLDEDRRQRSQLSHNQVLRRRREGHGEGTRCEIDGKQLSEPYLNQQTADFGPVTVQPGHLFVMGDNRSDSLDSRVPCTSGGLGQVPISDVVGKASIRIWPLNRLGLLH